MDDEEAEEVANKVADEVTDKVANKVADKVADEVDMVAEMRIKTFHQMANLPNQRRHPQNLQNVDIAQDEVNGEPEGKDEEDHHAQPLRVVGIHVKEANPAGQCG